MKFGSNRPLIAQDFFTFPVVMTNNTQPVVLNAKLGKQSLITTFVISNPAAGFSCYLGGDGVTLPAGNNPGFEIQAGTAPAFKQLQEGRQLYELQALQINIAEGLQCQNADVEKIPFIVFDLSKFFLISSNAAGQTVTVIAFPQMYL